jgi:hypothetical protein
LQQADKYRVRATEKEFKTTKKALDEAASVTYVQITP